MVLDQQHVASGAPELLDAAGVAPRCRFSDLNVLVNTGGQERSTERCWRQRAFGWRGSCPPQVTFL